MKPTISISNAHLELCDPNNLAVISCDEDGPFGIILVSWMIS